MRPKHKVHIFYRKKKKTDGTNHLKSGLSKIFIKKRLSLNNLINTLYHEFTHFVCYQILPEKKKQQGEEKLCEQVGDMAKTLFVHFVKGEMAKKNVYEWNYKTKKVTVISRDKRKRGYTEN